MPVRNKELKFALLTACAVVYILFNYLLKNREYMAFQARGQDAIFHSYVILLVTFSVAAIVTMRAPAGFWSRLSYSIFIPMIASSLSVISISIYIYFAQGKRTITDLIDPFFTSISAYATNGSFVFSLALLLILNCPRYKYRTPSPNGE